MRATNDTDTATYAKLRKIAKIDIIVDAFRVSSDTDYQNQTLQLFNIRTIEHYVHTYFTRLRPHYLALLSNMAEILDIAQYAHLLPSRR
jgi:hypothetical protein